MGLLPQNISANQTSLGISRARHMSLPSLLIQMAVISAACTSATALRILAFGDSLTEGYYNRGFSFHPYSERLKELILQDKPGSEVKVEQMGKSGELVVPSMEKRLRAALEEAQAAGKTYDWVVLLGGINDLGWGHEPEDIFEGLENMYMNIKRHGAKIIPMTLLETQYSTLHPDHEKSRQKVNSLIRAYCKDNTKGSGMFLLDLEREIPYVSADPTQRKQTWDDGLHLTPAGYDYMAQLIYGKLKTML